MTKFASDAYAKLCEQDDYIQLLQCDLKTAIEGYRALAKEQGSLVEPPVLKTL